MKFKVGDKVTITDLFNTVDDPGFNDTMEKLVGTTMTLTENFSRDRWHVKENNFTWIEPWMKKGEAKQKKVNFLLKYDTNEHTIEEFDNKLEEFETIKEINNRIKHLIKIKSSLKKDSIVIYEVKTKHSVSLSTKITRKLIK